MFLPIYTILELFGLEAQVVLLTPRKRQRTCIPYLMAPREHVLGENDLGRIKPEKIQKTVICTRNFLTGMAWLQVRHMSPLLRQTLPVKIKQRSYGDMHF
jgi:hypothetical protein